MKKISKFRLLVLLTLLAFGHAFAADAVIGLNFSNNSSTGARISGGTADGFSAWTDSRAVGDGTQAAVQSTPLALGSSGVTATWSSSNTWSAGAQNNKEQSLYRVYLDDGGSGVRVTIKGLAAWMSANGKISYSVRCYTSSDYARSFRPISIRSGTSATGSVLHTMTPPVLGNGYYPTSGTVPTSAGPARGHVDSPDTLTADTITLTIPTRSGTLRGTLAAIKITGVAPPEVPPVVVTLSATEVTDTLATVNGTVNANDLETTVAFEYGPTTAYGSTAWAAPPTLSGTTTTAVSAVLENLSANTTYHYRVAATNPGGTTHGSDRTFTTGDPVFLSGLTVDAGALIPSFSKTVTSYSLQVPSETSSIRVTPVAEEAGSTIRVQGVAAASGATSDPIPLAVGKTTITTAVTAVGGTFAKNYVVTVTRPPLTHVFDSPASVPVTMPAFKATGRRMDLSLNFAPVTGTSLTVVNNTALGFIEGEFDNLAHGQRVDLVYDGISYPFVANYHGGTGNDLVLQWANTRLLGWGLIDGVGVVFGDSYHSKPTMVPLSGELSGKTFVSFASKGKPMALCLDGTLAYMKQRVEWVAMDAEELGVLADKRVIAISSGSEFMLALCADGTVAAWGKNNSGQLGNGSYSYSDDPTPPAEVVRTGVLRGKTVVAIAAGWYHSLALCSDGTVVAWGSNSGGALGRELENNSTSSFVPVEVDRRGILKDKTVASVVVGNRFSMALCVDGTLAAWGANSYGQLGNGTTEDSPLPMPVKLDGVLRGKKIVEIRAGDSMAMALCSDGTLATWGGNYNGQLGDGTTTDRHEPVQISNKGVLASKRVVDAWTGNYCAFALCSNGDIAAWGNNESSRLGIGESGGPKKLPVDIDAEALEPGARFVSAKRDMGGASFLAAAALPPAALVATGAVSGIATSSATLHATANANGGTTEKIRFEYGPTDSYGLVADASPSSLSGKTDVAASAAVGGLLSGTTYHYRVVASGTGGTVYGEDRIFTTSDLAELAGLGTDVGRLCPEFDHSTLNYSLVVPSGASSIVLAPSTAYLEATVRVMVVGTGAVEPGTPISLHAGANKVAVIVTSGDGAVSQSYQVTVFRLPEEFAFASPTDAALSAGGGDIDGLSAGFSLNFTPVPGTVLTVLDKTGIGPIEGRFANLEHGQCILLEYGGKAYPFVANYYGGTGNDLVLQWAQVRLYSWGANSYGQLGNGEFSDWNHPVLHLSSVDMSGALAGKTVVSLGAGTNSSMAAGADGSLAMWGFNDGKLLTAAWNSYKTVPVDISGKGALVGKKVVDVVMGAGSGAALCSDGTVAIWGWNSNVDYEQPVELGRTGVLAGKTVVAIAGENRHYLALCSDGTIIAWGYNEWGQLGNTTTLDSYPNPVEVVRTGALAGKKVVSVDAGTQFSLALCADGTAVGWGANHYGRLGDGTTKSSAVPVPVRMVGALAGKRIVAIEAGGEHTLALCSDGTLAAWGRNNLGQLGNGSTTDSPVPVSVYRSGVLAGKKIVGMKASSAVNLVSCSDGTLAAWGSNHSGALGDGTKTNRTSPVRVRTDRLQSGERFLPAEPSTSGSHSMAIVARPLGSVAETLAADSIRDTSVRLHAKVFPNGGGGTVSFEFGLDEDYGWSAAASPSSVSGTSERMAAAALDDLLPGTVYHYRVVVEGTDRAWKGEDMIFTTSDKATLAGLTSDTATLSPEFSPKVADYAMSVPNSVASISFVPVGAHEGQTILVNGTAVASGAAIGPVSLAEGANVIRVEVESSDGTNSLLYTVKVTRTPRAVRFTTADRPAITVPYFDAAESEIALGLGFAPPVGTALTLVENTGIDVIGGSFDNLAHGQHVVLEYGGVYYEFVANYFGGTGNDLMLQWANTKVYYWRSSVPGVAPLPDPDLLAGKTIVGLAGNRDNRAMALCMDGSMVDVTHIESWESTEFEATGALEGKRIVAISGGDGFFLALCVDGTLAAWGDDSDGQLGSKYVNGYNNFTPVEVDRTGVLAGKRVVAIAAGEEHSLALCADGTLAAWGENDRGQLGRGTTEDADLPVAVDRSGVLADRKVIMVAAGTTHSLALCWDGTLVAWGTNWAWQLGNEDMDFSSVPVVVEPGPLLAGKKIVSISAGRTHNLVLCSDGTLAAWGKGYGALGIGGENDPDRRSSSVPVAVVTSGVLAGKEVIDAGAPGPRSFALCSDGTLAGWGDNQWGQLGISGASTVYLPARINLSKLRPGEKFVALGDTDAFGIVAAPMPPMVATREATGVKDLQATLNAGVFPNGRSVAVGFEYGPTDEYGMAIPADPAQYFGSGEKTPSAILADLLPGHTYHYRVVAEADGGTVFGVDMTFTTTVAATLAGLSLDGAALAPEFAPDRMEYRASVPFGTASLSVTPIAAYPGAAIRVGTAEVASGEASPPMPLSVGNNLVPVVVRSADGENVMVYRITVTRMPEVFAWSAPGQATILANGFTASGEIPEMRLEYAPQTGESLMIVDNTGTGPIDGTFDNLAPGQIVTLEHEGVRYPFLANYYGGTGNDLVLEWANTRLLRWGNENAYPEEFHKQGVLEGKRIVGTARGNVHTLMLCSDGTLAAVGSNSRKQLGIANPYTYQTSVPLEVDRSGALQDKRIVSVAAGWSHSLALCSDGTLAQWGNDSSSKWLVSGKGALDGKRVVAIEAGDYSSYALCSDGTVAAWGNASDGQLGDGKSGVYSSATPVGVDRSGVLAGKNVVAIAAGGRQCLALCSDGTLAAWGDNYYGQLGNDQTADSYVPVLVKRNGVLADKRVVAIAAGNQHSLALCLDGTLAAWGAGSLGQLGTGTGESTYDYKSKVPVAVDGTGVLAGKTVVAITAGYDHSVALCSDGTMAGWGNNAKIQMGVIGGLKSFAPKAMPCRYFEKGGRIIALGGGNQYKETLAILALPPQPGARTLAATGVMDRAATLNALVRPNGSGAAVCFEYGLTSEYGETAEPSPASFEGSGETPVACRIDGLLPGHTYHFRVVVEGGGGTVLGEDKSFSATTFGTLASLEPSVGAFFPAFERIRSAYIVTVPYAVDSLSLVPVADDAGASILVNGSAVASGVASPALPLAPGHNDISVEVSSADGANTTTYRVAVERLPAEFAWSSPGAACLAAEAFQAAGDAPPFALRFALETGSSLTMVDNTGTNPISGRFANLAQGQRVDLEFGGVVYPFVVNYFGGTGNDLVLEWGNTRVVCWGYGGTGELGNGQALNSPVPVPVVQTDAVAGKVLLTTFSCANRSYALAGDGTLAAWGGVTSGWLSTIRKWRAPVAVQPTGALVGKKIVKIAASGTKAPLYLCSDGSLVEQGNGGLKLVEFTGGLSGKRAASVARGGLFTAVLCTDGTVATWGYNTEGQLGTGVEIGSQVSDIVAVDRSGVLAGRKVVAMVAGSSHCLALCGDGTLVAWGNNAYGQLGNGERGADEFSPVAVDMSGVLAGKTVVLIAAGNNHTIVCCADGTLVAWGLGAFGQLGTGDTGSSSVPVAVKRDGALSGKTAVSVAAAKDWSLAVCSDGSIITWGVNDKGQLGNGTEENSNVPVAVDDGALRPGERFLPGIELFAMSSHCAALVASPPRAVLETLAADPVGGTGALLHASVRPNDSVGRLWFEYGANEAYGNTVEALPSELGGTAVQSVSAELAGLCPGSGYHYRVVCENVGGWSAGTDMTFTTSTAATLASLVPDAGELFPAFDPSTLGYSVTVPASVDSLGLSASPADPGASVEINGVTVAGGASGEPVALSPGANAISVEVGSADASFTTTYTVTVTRLPTEFTFDSPDDVPVSAAGFVLSGDIGPVRLGFAPAPGTLLTLFENTALGFIRGQFANLAHGQGVGLEFGGQVYPFIVNYHGGTGNDLVLEWGNNRYVGWGRNGSGQLGFGEVGGSQYAPLPAPSLVGALEVRTILSLATGYGRSFAVCSDASLAAWGSGKLGVGPTEGQAVPLPREVQIPESLQGKRAVSVAAGKNHSLALFSDGTIAAWGSNSKGQLGIGAVQYAATPTPVLPAGALAGRRPVAVGVGMDFSVALCEDGTLVAWGDNSNGVLGDGTTQLGLMPVRVGTGSIIAGKKVKSIAVGSAHVLALCTDGTLVAWGDNQVGQLGDGTWEDSLSPVKVKTTGVLAGKQIRAIAAGESFSMALCEDGTVAVWGNGSRGQMGPESGDSPVPVAINSFGVLAGKSVVQIEAGPLTAYALCSDGTIAAWGAHYDGETGNGDTSVGTSPTPVAVSTEALNSSERFVSLAAGASAGHIFARVATPLKATVETLAATEVGENTATLHAMVGTGGLQTEITFEYGLTTEYGQDVAASQDPAGGESSVGFSAVLDGLLPGSTYHYRVVAISDGGISAGEDRTFTTTDFTMITNLVPIAGTLFPGFDPTVREYFMTLPGSVGSISLTVSTAHPGASLEINGAAAESGVASAPVSLPLGNIEIPVRVISEDGSVTWTCTVSVTRMPATIVYQTGTEQPVVSERFVASGIASAFALRYAPESGTTLMVVNHTGRGFIAGRFADLEQGQIVELMHDGICYRFVANYYGGDGNDLVLQWADTWLAGWGYNYQGQLGNGSGTSISKRPVPVFSSGVLFGKTVVDLASGGGHTLALCSDGTLAAWGNNEYGRVGDGTTTHVWFPVKLGGAGALADKRVIRVAAGTSHSLVLCEDGTLVSWGRNRNGELGNGTTHNSPEPVEVDRTGVLAGKTVIDIAAGYDVSYALCLDGTIAAWGYNDRGQLGTGEAGGVRKVAVEADRSGVLAGKIVVSLKCTSSHCLALCADGTLVSWGSNSYGQIGNNSTENSPVPVAVDTSGVLAGKQVVAVAAGASHSLALCSDGTLVAWGRNNKWQLGDNSTSGRQVPVEVDRSGVLDGRRVVAVNAAANNSMALCADGTLATWGDNAYGRLGTDDNYMKRVLVEVFTGDLEPEEVFVAGDVGSSFSTAIVASLPRAMAETLPAGPVTDTGATLRGQAGANGSAASVRFEYGLTEDYGESIDAEPAELGKAQSAEAHAALGGVASGTVYHYRIVCENGGGISYGEDITFTTTTDAVLAGLEPDTGALAPGFSVDVLDYSLSLPSSVETISLTPIAVASGALIRINGTLVESASASAPISLAPGNNGISLVVESADGLQTRTYMVNVVRLPEIFVFRGTGAVVSAPTMDLRGASASFELDFDPPVGIDLTAIECTGIEPILGTFSNLEQGQIVEFSRNGIVFRFVANYQGGTGNDLVLQWANVRLYGWGNNASGQLGEGNAVVAIPELLFPEDAFGGEIPLMVRGGGGFALAIGSDSTLFGWGSNSIGQLGNPLLGGKNPVPFPLSRSGVLAGKSFATLATGSNSTVVVCSDGSLFQWGYRLGSAQAPAELEDLGGLEGKRIVSVAHGREHALALCSDGTLGAWGRNVYGELGDGTRNTPAVPVEVDRSGVLQGKTVVAIAAGSYYSLALCSDGTMAAWGGNNLGYLGDGTMTDRMSPVQVATDGVLQGKNVVDIAVGSGHSLALCSDGTLVAWGWNAHGALGNDKQATNWKPTLVDTSGVLKGKTVVDIDAGTEFSVALCSDGTVVTWGRNDYGQIGDGTKFDRNTPVALDASNFPDNGRLVGITAGSAGRHALAILALPPKPGAIAEEATGVTDLSATLNGRILPNGNECTVEFEWGKTASYGNIAPATPETVSGSEQTNVRVVIDGRAPATVYHYRVRVASPNGAAVSEDRTFTTGSASALAGLSLSAGRIDPEFLPCRFRYGATVSPAVASVAVTPVAADSGATIKVNGQTVVSGTASEALELAEGENRVTVEVTSSDASMTQDYEIVVLRLPGVFRFASPGEPAIVAGHLLASDFDVAFALDFDPVPGTALTVVENTGAASIGGHFANLAPGQVVDLEHGGKSYRFVTNYFGGDGNDLVLEWAQTRLLGWGTATNPSSDMPVNAGPGGTVFGGDIAGIVTGGAFHLALHFDGTVCAWGDNSNGQLGDGSFTNSPDRAVEVDRSGVLADKHIVVMAAGGTHSLALCADGTLAAWGDNVYGQLGVGDTESQLGPVLVDSSGALAGKTVVAVAAGMKSSYALCSDGTVVAWGDNSRSQLGIGLEGGLRAAPVAADHSGALADRKVVKIAAGKYHVLALCEDGTLVAWGDNEKSQIGSTEAGEGRTTEPSPLIVDASGVLAGKRIVEIGAGSAHSVVLCSDGTLAAWGDNDSGQLGNGSCQGSASTPILVGNEGVLIDKTVTKLAVGTTHNMVLCSDGTVLAWGSDNSGQLGNGDEAASCQPVEISKDNLLEGERIQSIFTGPQSAASFAISSLPEWPGVATLPASPVGSTSVTLRAEINPAGFDASVFFDYGPSADYIYSAEVEAAEIPGTSRSAASLVLDDLVPGSVWHYRVRIETLLGTFLGEDQVVTTSTDATLAGLEMSPGTLYPGFSGTGTAYTATLPFSVQSVALRATAAGSGAVIEIGGMPVSSGSPSGAIPLAVGPNAIPVKVTAPNGDVYSYTLTVFRMPEKIEFVSPDIPVFTAGQFHASGALPPVSLGFRPGAGTVLTLVDNTGGAAIRGSFDNLAHGQVVELEHAGSIYRFVADYSGGDGNDLVLQWARTRLMAWGLGTDKQLGTGFAGNSSIPVDVPAVGALAGRRILSVSPGYRTNYAVDSTGRVLAWGYNHFGLGVEDLDSSTVPVEIDHSGVLAGKTVVSIAAGGSHAMALCRDGTLAAWGYNNYGQLGDGTRENSKTPVLVEMSGAMAGKKVVRIAAGSNFSLALCDDGSLFAWGRNSKGQFGDGRSGTSTEPVEVRSDEALSGKTVVAIAAGNEFAHALCDDGTVVSWGNNNAGQLGVEGMSLSRVPVPVDASGALDGKQVVAISASGGHSLALCSDGTLVAWGWNSSGQLGNASTKNSSVPVRVVQSGLLEGREIVSILAAREASFALCADGTLASWGANKNGLLGDTTTDNHSQPVQTAMDWLMPGERVMALPGANSGSHMLAMIGVPVATAEIFAAADITGISATLSGTINGYGAESSVRFEIGEGDAFDVVVPVDPGIVDSRFDTSVSTPVGGLRPGTTYHFRVVVENEFGTIRSEPATFTTLSDNAHLASLDVDGWQAGPDFDRDTTEYYVSVPYDADAVSLTVATEHAGARIWIDGVPVSSGAASQPVSITANTTAITVHVLAEDGIATMDYTMVVIRLPQQFVFNAAGDIPVAADGFSARGVNADIVLNFRPEPGTILTMVDNTGIGFIHGVFGNLAQGQRVRLGFGGEGYDFVANYYGGTGNDLVLQWADTKVLAWGAGNYGQLGDGTPAARKLMPGLADSDGVLFGKTVTAVSTGYLHSLALCADGTLAAWGYNAYGQLGDGSTVSSGVPVAVDQSGVLAGKLVVAISAGPFHNLALCADGTVVAWGYNNHGQLGTGDTSSSRVPVTVRPIGAPGGVAPALSLRGAAMSGIAKTDAETKTDKSAGSDPLVRSVSRSLSEGFDGTTRSKIKRGKSASVGKQVVAVAAGAYQSFALCSDGTVAAWGYNDEGELGDGSTTGRLVPVAVDASGVLAGRKVAALAAGQYHALALCTDGSVVAWGYNAKGQLGSGGGASVASPVEIGSSGVLSGKTVKAVAAGGSHSMALCTDGTLAAWGANRDGQLGTGNTAQSAVPAAVALSDAVTVQTISRLAAGRNHNVMLHLGGNMSSWGDNSMGQLGNGTTESANAPGDVAAGELPAGAHFMFVAGGASARHNLAVAGVPMAPGDAFDVADLDLWMQGFGIPSGSADSDDFDRDGISNLMEYAFGLDPARNSAGQLPGGRIEGDRFTIRFARPAGVTGIRYGAEWSATMEPGSWQDVPDTGIGGEHIFGMPMNASPKLFMRLKVTRQ